MDVSITYHSTMRPPAENHISEILFTNITCEYCQVTTEELPSGERSFTHFLLKQLSEEEGYYSTPTIVVCYRCLEDDVGWFKAAMIKVSLEKSTDIDDLKPLLKGWMRSRLK